MTKYYEFDKRGLKQYFEQVPLFKEDFEKYDTGSFLPQANGLQWILDNFAQYCVENSQSLTVATHDSTKQGKLLRLNTNEDDVTFAKRTLPLAVSELDGSQYIEFDFEVIGNVVGTPNFSYTGLIRDEDGNNRVLILYDKYFDALRWYDGSYHTITFDTFGSTVATETKYKLRIYLESATKFHIDLSDDDGSTWYEGTQATVYEGANGTWIGYIMNVMFQASKNYKTDMGLYIDNIQCSWEKELDNVYITEDEETIEKFNALWIRKITSPMFKIGQGEIHERELFEFHLWHENEEAIVFLLRALQRYPKEGNNTNYNYKNLEKALQISNPKLLNKDGYGQYHWRFIFENYKWSRL